MIPAARCALLVAVAAATLGACDEAARPRRVEHLALDAPVATKRWDGLLVELGVPEAVPLLGPGWSWGETAPDGSAFRWAVGPRASLELEVDEPGRRLVWLDCEPFVPDPSRAQAIRLRVNGAALPELRLRPGRARYPVEVELRGGKNRLEMDFAYAARPADAAPPARDRRPLAVAFYRIEILPPGEAALAGGPGPFAVVAPGEGPPGLYLPAGGSIAFYRRLPPEAVLAVRLGAERPERWRAAPGTRLRVRVRAASGRLVEDELAPEGGRAGVAEARVDLGALAGAVAEIRLEAEGRGALVAASLEGRAEGPPPAAEPPPAAAAWNWLVVVLDGATALRMSAYGFDEPTTPSLEGLASRAVRFDAAVSQAVYTIASIGSLLTGQYPDRHRSVSFADRLPATAVTLPGLLTLAGYRTAAFSGNAVVSSTFGLDRGYETFHAAWRLEDYTGHGDSVLRLFDRWIEEHRDERFFAYVHFREPHFPYNPPEPWARRFGPIDAYPDGIVDWQVVEELNRAAARGEPVDEAAVRSIRNLYEANLAYVDALVGRLLGRLDALGLAERTAVIVTADHGEALFEHGFIGHNTQLFEESVRVPLLVRLPGIAPRRIGDVVELVDLAPTVLELVGLGGHPAAATMQGRSLVPLLEGRRPPGAATRIAFARTLWDKPRYAARDRRYKLVWDSRTGDDALYDLETDPGERKDASAAAPVVAGFLRQSLFRWLREQEHLRSGAAAPEAAVVPDELGRYLGGVGYLQYLETKENGEPKDPERRR